MRIINNKQGFSTETLMHLYWNEVKPYSHLNIESIVFEQTFIRIYGIDTIIAEVKYI